jgi:4a-hydroxytetrahydrobiopterin dehydratase
MGLTSKKCKPCEGATPRLSEREAGALLGQITGWLPIDDHRKLSKRWRFTDFKQAMLFINRMADLAEAENHHPDFAVHYDTVDVTLWTHAVGGLSENDFILAAKIDQLPDARSAT